MQQALRGAHTSRRKQTVEQPRVAHQERGR